MPISIRMIDLYLLKGFRPIYATIRKKLFSGKATGKSATIMQVREIAGISEALDLLQKIMTDEAVQASEELRKLFTEIIEQERKEQNPFRFCGGLRGLYSAASMALADPSKGGRLSLDNQVTEILSRYSD